jgi:hypothetical protein
MLPPGESYAFSRSVDVPRIHRAGDVLRDLRLCDEMLSSPLLEAEAARELALLVIESRWDSLIALREVEADYAAVAALAPHLVMSCIASGVRARERPATVADIFGRSA